MCLATLRPLNFSKEKKEKKKASRSSGRFQKSKFFWKNTTRYIIGSVGVKSELNVVANRYGWRFYQKPEAWTCFFVNLELTFALFFFIFCFDFIYQSSSYNRILFEGLGVDLEEGRLRKVYQILGMDKKSKSKNINAFYPALKFDTLSWIWFLRMPNRLMKWEVSI